MIEFLQPVDQQIIEFCNDLNDNQIGRNITQLSEEQSLIAKGSVVILFVPEYRGSCENKSHDDDQIRSIRKSFYELYLGNWTHNLVDIGTLNPGKELSDTYYALTAVLKEILAYKAIPLIIGGSQDLTYYQYRAFDETESMVNMVSIDYGFDLGDSKEDLHNHNYLSHCIVNKPYNLFNHSTLGYQTYYNDQDAIDLLDRLFFETYRLGELIDDLKNVEPILRDATLASIDCNSIRSLSLNNQINMPNGFNEREICQILRYVGIGERIKSLGIFEINKQNNPLFNELVAQMMWYFIEGYNVRMDEKIDINNPDFTRFTVPVDQDDLIFYKSELTNRWWIEIPYSNNQNNKLRQNTLLACSKFDYLEACDQELPDRWYRAKRKNLI